MKQAITLFVSLLMLTGTILAQKTIRDANAQSRNGLKNFHAVQVSNGIDLYLTQSSEEAVAVSAVSNEYRDKIITEVVDGVLKIYYEKKDGWNWGSNTGNKKLKAYVSLKNLDKLGASGGSDVSLETVIRSNKLSISISGGSDLKGEIQCDELSLSASGGSDAIIKGKAAQVKITASGGSDVEGYGLITDVCRVVSSGGSDVSITANKQMDATASGGSDIHYKGNATATTSKSGSSDIRKVTN
ncbi:MAG: head GIN domain-containing protein [Sediminibacterium sp.]|jgi:hypothetical protein